MRILTKIEENRIKILTKHSVSLTLIEPTETGLKKSIMDATGSVRGYLKEKGIHDFEIQKQGQDHKVIVSSCIYDREQTINTKTSLYRPKTKSGDPRIWVSGLPKYSKPNDIVGLIFFDSKLHVINITQIAIEELIYSCINNPIKELVEAINDLENLVANELLFKLKAVASKGYIPSLINADTSVGRTLETVLGIQINSSKKPDYKGIELKSFRAKKNNRKNLFAQVPNWEISKFKSSKEILDNFGYWREEDFKLYCTVSAINRNSQGLILRIDETLKYLVENSDKIEIGDFIIWELQKLHNRLLEKHKETFWIEAESKFIDGKEYFQYTQVEHTKKPIISQFDLLIDQGKITLDHLIKRNAKGKVVEKGPLFKINPKSLDLLFPPSTKYNLLDEVI